MSTEFEPLPAGRHRLTREQVAHSQRERLIAAFAHAVAERGYHRTTLADITGAASVSRRVFYENFADKEECFLAVFDIAFDRLRQLMEEATAKAPDWPHRVIAVLRAGLRFFASEPDLARLCLVEALNAGPVASERFRGAVNVFVPMLAQGRGERPGVPQLPASTEDSLLGATVLQLNRAISAGDTGKLERLLPDLAEFLLAPYMGQEEAERLARGPA